MDDFPGLLAKDFGFKPQGKPVPMAASKGTTSSRGTLNFGIGSVDETRSFSSSSNRARRDWNSNSVGNSLLDDHDDLFGSTSNQKTNDFGDLSDYNDVFGGPTKYANPPESIFLGSKESGANTSSSPVYDKPVYDDDIFDGVSGLKSSSSVNYKDVFSSMATPSKQSANFDDLLGNLGRTDAELKSSSGSRSKKVEKNLSDFEDLLPGFGGSSPPKNRATRKTSQLQQPTVPSTKSSSSVMEDPFVVLESASVPSYASSGHFTDDGLEQINKPNNIRSAKFDGSSVSGVFNDLDPLDGLTKSIPSFSYDMNNRGKDKSPLKKGTKTTPIHASVGKEPTEKPSLKTTGNASQKKVYKSPKSEDNLELVDDVWLTVSEIPLFTQPTSAPPPSRPPPPKPVQVLKEDNGSFSAVDTKKKVNKFSTFQHSSQNFQSPKIDSDSVRNTDVSSVDELEDFSMGGLRNNADERSDVLSSEEELDTNPTAASSAAAMKEAMDRAEAKFKHAREVRERENTKVGRSKDASQQEEHENAMQDSQERDLREKQERLNSEQEQREREEKEREQRRRDMERERGKARQAVERATKEARDRAAIEARVKAERAAVGKVNAEARGRAERAAVQRAQAEARERAASEARERAERIAAESKERANAEARERASVARAEAEVRLRAERAAVDRAAAEARVRAAAVARENQKKNESDLESFFGMGARPTSAPRTRTTTPDAGFDGLFQNREVPEVPRRPSTGTPSSMRKASSTMKFGDDLTSIFGGTPSSGDFQEIDGESEERRRARLERQQRTQERAAQALAVKNQRDLQTQRDQAERHRIAETVDVEIRRWAAGKEGNLRALLSTLQYVLWPECGWQTVSLIDLIAAASVKKAYRKATLCVHPDKVQQKGASIQQKYIAEKVFDLLKEAWNKFNSEELF